MFLTASALVLIKEGGLSTSMMISGSVRQRFVGQHFKKSYLCYGFLRVRPSQNASKHHSFCWTFCSGHRWNQTALRCFAGCNTWANSLRWSLIWPDESRAVSHAGLWRSSRFESCWMLVHINNPIWRCEILQLKICYSLKDTIKKRKQWTFAGE